MNILFVCKYNRFRSQIAEQFFKKYNRNKNISAKSAGIFRGLFPLDKAEKKTVKDFGINISKEPKTISIDILRGINLVVIVADDVPKELFLYEGRYLQKVLQWDIDDEYAGKVDNIKKITEKIEINVKSLVKQLEKSK